MREIVLLLMITFSDVFSMCTIPFVDLSITVEYVKLNTSECVTFATTSVYDRTDGLADACVVSSGVDTTNRVIYISKEGSIYQVSSMLIKDVYQTSTVGTVYYDCEHPPIGKSTSTLNLFYKTTSVGGFESHAIAVQEANSPVYIAPGADRPRLIFSASGAAMTTQTWPSNTWQPFHTITDTSHMAKKSIIDMFHDKRFLAILTYHPTCISCKASIAGSTGVPMGAIHTVLFPLLRKYDVAIAEVHDVFQTTVGQYSDTGSDTLMKSGFEGLYIEYGKNLTELPYFLWPARKSLEPDDTVLGAFLYGQEGRTIEQTSAHPSSIVLHPLNQLFGVSVHTTSVILLENTGSHVRLVTYSYLHPMRHDPWFIEQAGVYMYSSPPEPNTCKLMFHTLGGDAQDAADCFSKESSIKPMTFDDTCEINKVRYDDYCGSSQTDLLQGLRNIHKSYSCCS